MKEKNSRKRIAFILPVVVIAIVSLIVFSNKGTKSAFQKDSGFIFGTSYNITYQHSENLKNGIVEVLDSVDNSLSPFNDKSIITAVNRNEDTTLDSKFTEVWTLSGKVYADTDGAFDITVAPLVNAWGFGFKSGKMPSESQIDSIKSFVGFNKVSLHDGKVTKQDSRTMLDCSAIAKGYAVDCVARYLIRNGVENFMVEIGGEVVTRGCNASNKPWRIGVTKPTDDTLAVSNELQTVLEVTDIAMATSGNYRNYYIKGGKKYAHTIDPRLGVPVQHSLLSSTVFAPTCAEADAYATSFMVMGLEKAKGVLKRNPQLTAYFIYDDGSGALKVWHSEKMKEYIAR